LGWLGVLGTGFALDVHQTKPRHMAGTNQGATNMVTKIKRTCVKGALVATALVASFALAETASAGARLLNWNVTATSTVMKGSLSAARKTSDDVQNIGCYTRAMTGSAPYVLCRATDQFGTTRGCQTSDPNFLRAVESMTDESFIEVYINTSNGQCNQIMIYDESSKKP
jgi:hypothetical protein